MDEKLFELLCIENDFAKYFAKFRNLSINLFRTLRYFLKLIISIPQDKLNFLVLHNFTKCFSMHHGKSNSLCLVFSVPYFGSVKKDVYKTIV